MHEEIDQLIERTRKLTSSPYGDEKATNAQLAELAQVVEALLSLLKAGRTGA
jgi:hypothetical protein